MSVKLWRLCISLLPIFLILSVSAGSLSGKLENALVDATDQLSAASSQSTAQSTITDRTVTVDLREKDRPIILTIDGIAPMSEATNGLIGAKRQTKSYLKNPVIEWGIASHAEFAAWNGDTGSTDDYIEGIKAQIEHLSQRAQLEHRQFIVVGHSWGSVLAARAIAEVGAARKGDSPPFLVNQLITFGSPLNAQDFVFKVPATKEMGDTDYRDAAPYIGLWKNFWLASDNISGLIPNVATNTQLDETQAFGRLPFRSHSAYYKVDDLWRYIGSDMTADLIRAARVENNLPVTPEIVASNGTVATEAEPEESERGSGTGVPSQGPITPTLEVTLTSLVTARTQIPGSSENFKLVEHAAIDGDKIAFIGGIHSTGDGIYQIDSSGPITIVVDRNTPKPDQPSSAFPPDFSDIDVDGDSVVFGHRASIYRVDNKRLAHVLYTPPFGGIRELAAQGGDIAFITSTGVFHIGPSGTTVVADTKTVPPGAGASFLRGQFRDIAVRNGQVAFTGYGSGRDGVYLWRGGTLDVLDSGTSDFTDVALDDQRVVFERVDSLKSGELVVAENGGLNIVIDREGAQRGVNDVFADSGRIAFSRTKFGEQSAIYVWDNNILTKIFDIADLLDGRKVWNMELAGFSGNTLIFIARWDPFTADLYRADISTN